MRSDQVVALPRQGWLNRTVLGISLASLFSDLSHETVTSVLPAFLASLGVAAAALGTIEGVADGLATGAKLYGGWWADRLHRRKTLCGWGYGIMAASTILIGAAWHWVVVLTGRALAWVARGLRTPPRKALLAEAVTPGYYGRAFGFERTMDTVGAAIAPVVALLLLHAGVSHRVLIYGATVPALLAILAILFLVRETPRETVLQRSLFSSYRDLPSHYWKLLRWIGLFGAGDFAHSLMILYATQSLRSQMDAADAARWAVLLYAIHNIFYAAVSFPAGHLADRGNKRKLLALGYGLGTATALVLASQVSALPLLAITFALGGIYVGMEETLEDSLAAERLPATQRGAGFGLLALVNGCGDLVSSVLTGWLWSVFGPTVAFLTAASLMGAGSLALLVTDDRPSASTDSP